ncbi:MAG: hypothetical protein AAF493_23995 [Pseudomonadota bacterium]
MNVHTGLCRLVIFAHIANLEHTRADVQAENGITPMVLLKRLRWGWVAVTLVMALPGAVCAAPVTIQVVGTVTAIDSELAAGPFAVGDAVSGRYEFENDPTLNPDFSPPGSPGQYEILSWSAIGVGSEQLNPTVSFGIAIFDGGVDGYDAATRATGPSIGSYAINSVSISLRDTSGSALSSIDLLPGPPSLSSFDIDQSRILYISNGDLAQIDVNVESLTVVPLPGALPLFATAFAATALWRRRRLSSAARRGRGEDSL